MEKKIICYNDFLSNDLLDECQETLKSTIKSATPYFGKTNLCWEYGIVKSSTTITIIEVTEEYSIYIKLKNEIELHIGLIPNRIMFYVWPKLSYIPWHDDNHVKSALTIYLNDFWDEDWGGYFMFKNNEKIEAIKPKLNLGVHQLGGVTHCVNTVNIDADNRITIQVFFK